MDKTILLRKEIQEFIKEHESDDLSSLLLKHSKDHGLPIREIVEQIKARKKAVTKLPTWYNKAGILYPPSVSIEQSSSERTANFKTAKLSGAKALDLTGGFGVDSYFLAQKFETVTYLEPNKELATIADHNFVTLGAKNIKVLSITAEQYIKTTRETYDLVYIDPDRRPDAKRVVTFSDSRPDLPSLLTELTRITSTILVKASPMMDIGASLKELEDVTEVTVLAIDNEVKELLFKIQFNSKSAVLIRGINIRKKIEEVFEFHYNEEKQEACNIDDIKKFLYEPNGAILKAGAFNTIGIRFGLSKLNAHTHLYTSDQYIGEFPGRVFDILANCNYQKKEIASFLTDGKANLSTRNFVDSPQQMMKKLGTKDGGDIYLFGYRNFEGKNKVAVCIKV
jgi:predicted O-methyltransferase YrrM